MDFLNEVWAAVRKENFLKEQHSPLIQDAFEEIVRNGNQWMVVHTFSKHIDPANVEEVFSDRQAFELWTSWTADSIKSVTYDWSQLKAIITLANEEVHEFDCNENWTYQDCLNAVKEL